MSLSQAATKLRCPNPEIVKTLAVASGINCQRITPRLVVLRECDFERLSEVYRTYAENSAIMGLSEKA